MRHFYLLVVFCFLGQAVSAQRASTFEQWRQSNESGSAVVQDPETAVIEFKGVPITGDIDAFAAQLQAQGYTPLTVIDDAVVMTGKFVNEDCYIYLLPTAKTKQVWKVAVVICREYTSWSSIKTDFNDYKELYIRKYGAPSHDYHFFSSPYYEGDGFEMSALQLDKCHYYTAFAVPGGVVVVTMISDCHISFRYENTANSELHTAESESNMMDDI